jgi:hypothetical protein
MFFFSPEVTNLVFFQHGRPAVPATGRLVSATDTAVYDVHTLTTGKPDEEDDALTHSDQQNRIKSTKVL